MTIDYKGHKITLTPDEDVENPRRDFNHDSTFAFFHKRYDLGDKTHPFRTEDFANWDELEAAIRERYHPAYITPVYMYDHSGLVLSTSPFACRWDSGQVGFMWISGPDPARLVDVVEAEIEELNQYLRGDVWCWQVDEDGDSCCGCYGMDYAINEAKESIDANE